MNSIISATNRPGSKTYQVACILEKIYQSLNYPTQIISLLDMDFQPLLKNPYPNQLPANIEKEVKKINHSKALTIVCPEYNGSFPGILKFFIDHWTCPDSFQFKPMSFIGLGGQWGGLRAVEQLQQIMVYRKAFIYPQPVFLRNIESLLRQEGDGIQDEQILKRLNNQAKNFLKFIDTCSEFSKQS